MNKINLLECFMTWAGLRHIHHPIPEVRLDESVTAAGQRNDAAFRQMNRTTMRSIMASCESAETVRGVLDRIERQRERS
jgi:hypothetical protein